MTKFEKTVIQVLTTSKSGDRGFQNIHNNLVKIGVAVTYSELQAALSTLLRKGFIQTEYFVSQEAIYQMTNDGYIE